MIIILTKTTFKANTICFGIPPYDADTIILGASMRAVSVALLVFIFLVARRRRGATAAAAAATPASTTRPRVSEVVGVRARKLGGTIALGVTEDR